MSTLSLDLLLDAYYTCPSPEPVYDLNSIRFDASLYSHRILRSSSVMFVCVCFVFSHSGLLSVANVLVEEIRTLNSERQMIVYENYNK